MKKICNLGIGAPSLLLFLIITAFLGTSVIADRSAEIARDQQSSPTYGEPVTGPSNLCEDAAVRDNTHLEFTESHDSPLIAVLDGDPNTYLAKRTSSDQWLEIRFPGPGCWINIIEIEYTGDDQFKFEAFNFTGSLREVKVISREITEGSESRKTARIEIEPVRAKGFRWSPAADAPANGQTLIYDIRMQWFTVDPDNPDNTNWLLCENISGMGTSDMAPLWRRITSRPLWAPPPAGAHWPHWWNGMAAWSGDFRRGPVGREGVHPWPGWDLYTGMDYHDLSGVAVHGAPGLMQFPSGGAAGGNPARFTAPVDHANSWGNRDADWFFALSCSVYQWTTGAFRMARGFGGLHLQCGFQTSAMATGGRFLGLFARRMTAGWAWGIPITRAWFLASSATQPGWVRPIVLADLRPQFRDHLWGYGPVWNDGSGASPNYALLTLGGPILTTPAKGNSSGLTFEQQQAISEAFTGPSARLMPATTSFGVPVRTTEELFRAGRFPAAVTVYTLSPPNVDSQYIQGLTDSLCYNYALFCAPVIGIDENGNWSAVQDSLVIWSNSQYGYVQFANIDNYLETQQVQPSIPTTGSAIATADFFLANLGISPTGSYTIDTSYNCQAAFDAELETIDPDSSFDLSVNVGYSRVVGGYPVFGPGGYIVVTVGEGDTVQHFTKGGWQDLTNPTSEDVIDVADAIALINALGEDATIGGIPPICDTLVINAGSAELAYYNTNGEYETDILEPIYHFTSYGVSAEDTVETDIYVPARANKVWGFIDSPFDGQHFSEDAQITFVGSATGGSSNYTFDWSSDVDGYLGTGDTISTTLSYTSDTAGVIHVITLDVTDNGTGEVVHAHIKVLSGGIGKVPTLSEWGLIIYSLLILTLITVVVVRKKMAGAGPGGSASISVSGPIFFPLLYVKTLTAALGLAALILVIATVISGLIPLRDIVGTILSAGIVAYIVHLWVALSNRDN